MEGKINFFETVNTNGNKPHFRGFLEIGGEVHEFAVWPAKTGKGFSGRYKPKEAKEIKEIKEEVRQAAISDEIPF